MWIRRDPRAIAVFARVREKFYSIGDRGGEALSEWRTMFPEDAGIGFTPARLAKAASDRTRPGCDHAVSATAAVTGPIPGCSSSPPAGLWLTRSVIRLELAVRSASSATTRFASRVASARAAAMATFSARVRQVEILAIWLLASGRRESIPRSATRTSAVKALTAAVRSVLIWSRAETKTRTAARMPSSARGWRSLIMSRGRTAWAMRRASSGSDLPTPRLARSIHPCGFNDEVSGIGSHTRQAGTVGSDALNYPERLAIAAGTVSNPRHGSGQTGTSGRKLAIIKDFTIG
jgi:hypothetical protein